MVGPAGVPFSCEIVVMFPISEAGLAVVRKHAIAIRAVEDVIAAGCDRAAAGVFALLPVLVNSSPDLGSKNLVMVVTVTSGRGLGFTA